MDAVILALGVISLHLVLHVVEQCLQARAEQLFHQVARQLEPFVGVVVLVVRLTATGRQLEHFARHAAEEERLLAAHFLTGREVRQQGVVDDVVDALAPVLFRLPGGKTALQVLQRLFGREDRFVLVNLLDVGQHLILGGVVGVDG